MHLRRRTPFARGMALFLCAQPVLWMSDVALAQTLDPRSAATDARGAEAPAPGAVAPSFGAGLDQQRTQERTQQAVPAQPIDEPLDPERYVLGPGDVLELHFWGIENFRIRATVDLQGRAFVARIGYLELAGKTLAQAHEITKASVARFFPKLGFGMNLAEPRTFLVQVVDAVAKPGPQPAKALERVSTVLARAGGLAANGSLRRIEIIHRDGTSSRADLLLYNLTGDVKHNPFVLDGDVVRVPFQAVVVEVAGAVNRPGSYELTGSMDLVELVSLAGGLSPGVTRELPVTVIRRAPEDRLRRIAIDFPAGSGMPAAELSAEDRVWVPAFAELQQSITITGALAGVAASRAVVGRDGRATTLPGAEGAAAAVASDEAAATRRIPYANGDTVRSVLERVGGPGPLADLKGSFILRKQQVVTIDLYALFVLRDFSVDRPVELGDTIVLPFRTQNVLVEGAVFRPGAYPFNPTFSVDQYLALAGGPNRFAQGIDDVYLVTPRGETKEYAPDLRVEPGASLVVPERNFSRSEVVALILAGAGLLLSAATIWITLRK